METMEAVTAEELVEDIQKGVFQQQLEKLIPKFWSFGWSVVLALIVFFVGSKIIKGIIKLFHKTMDRHDFDPGVETFLRRSAHSHGSYAFRDSCHLQDLYERYR